MAVQTKRFINSTKSCSCNMTGVWRACAYCQGLVIIFHAPRACSHVARRMDVSAYYYALGNGVKDKLPLVPLLSSQLEEKHSIFGGGERLADCIRFAAKTYAPECIMVANSCVAGVIGDDVPSICEELEQELDIPILTIDSYGFMDGEYYQGYYDTAKLFAKRFLKPCVKEPNTFLLVGDGGGPWGEYSQYVKAKLEDLGLKYIGQFPGYLPFKELEALGRAEYLVPLGRFGKTDDYLTKLVQELSQSLNIKFVQGKYPLGLAASRSWLEAWCELVGKPKAAEKMLAQEQAYLNKMLQRYLPVTESRSVILCLGRSLEYYHPKEMLEILRLLKLNLEAVVLLDAYDEAERNAMEQEVKRLISCPIIYQSQADTESRLAETELVITTHELKLGNKKQIFIPMIPRVGIDGLLAFMEIIYRLLCSRISNGGTTYVRG